MRAFLSHSSRDKGFVEGVASLLKPGTFELDSETFDAGFVNSEAIIAALKRCDLFCLFLSSSSVSSRYVDFETLIGMELFAGVQFSRFLAICLDDSSFSLASSNVKFFNVIRKGVVVENTASLIMGSLVSASSAGKLLMHPFIGREDALAELERQVIDPERPSTKALYVSGNFGTGRRTLVRKFYQNQFPHVGSLLPKIDIGEYFGLEELYRRVLFTLRPTIGSYARP